ncbi:HopJ type III effector protein [Saccharospirillum salsuginis]|uniref:Type III effector n=1 Tax=Saccharospirillum salsuginis TaxID=418750 RepID=A0A918K3W6_9GAMM|nr:HopJ type III effector protein [Saccharospirillum salsuginis]GGX47898.1 type III effector [Saccharospirillum salsuginis]
MSLQAFVDRIYSEPEAIAFDETIAAIDRHFDFTPTAFSVGEQHNGEGSNLGSCKILAFGHLMNLPEPTTLHLFGDYFRVDVLQHPDGDDHQNIRQFLRHGWRGVSFKQIPLKAK